MRLLAAIGMLLVLAACGEDEPGGESGSGPKVPATSRALVAVAMTHLDVEPTFFEALDDPDADYGKGALGGLIRHSGKDVFDSNVLRLTVTPTTKAPEICEEAYSCVVTQTEQGKLTIGWQEEEPEEDPGILSVFLQREDELVWLEQSDEPIEGDPRKQDLKVSVDDMIAIAEDPALSLMTTPAAIDAGEKLSPWTR
jgi:hypothetical protein